MLKLPEFRGIHIWEATEVPLLMYADDIVLVGQTIIQLQRKKFFFSGKILQEVWHESQP